jgi:acyl-coenzyme A synthetase/AMP-(fatty) acid ligase
MDPLYVSLRESIRACCQVLPDLASAGPSSVEGLQTVILGPGGQVTRPPEPDDEDPLGRASSAEENAAGPDHLCYSYYTSGSTGKPKGVLVEHRNVVQRVPLTPPLALNPHDRWQGIPTY